MQRLIYELTESQLQFSKKQVTDTEVEMQYTVNLILLLQYPFQLEQEKS